MCPHGIQRSYPGCISHPSMKIKSFLRFALVHGLLVKFVLSDDFLVNTPQVIAPAGNIFIICLAAWSVRGCVSWSMDFRPQNNIAMEVYI